LEKAVAEEDFETAATARDEIKRLREQVLRPDQSTKV
jgi:protein-arginine kinase activator protein McsA